MTERFEFLCRRLSEGKKGQRTWWLTWMTVYATLTTVQLGGIALASVLTKTRAEARAFRYRMIIGATSSSIGVVTMGLSYPAGYHGCRNAKRLRDGTPAGERRALAKAEHMLRKMAKDVSLKRGWLGHVGAFLVNLAAGLSIWLGLHQTETAAMQSAIGFSIAEIQLLTQPTKSVQDYKDYRTAFPDPLPAVAPRPVRPRLGFYPTLGGAGMVLRY